MSAHRNALRFKRSLAEAFPDERAPAVQRFVSNKLRHRALRFMRRLVRWLENTVNRFHWRVLLMRFRVWLANRKPIPF